MCNMKLKTQSLVMVSNPFRNMSQTHITQPAMYYMLSYGGQRTILVMELPHSNGPPAPELGCVGLSLLFCNVEGWN